MDYLINLDKNIFHLVNSTLKNSFLDLLMPLITTSDYWKIPILAIFMLVAVYGKKKGRETFIVCLIALVISDLAANRIFKPLFMRPRPFETLQDACQMVKAYGYSMPSSHAANSFSIALVASYIWKKRWLTATLISISLIVGFSRVYVGVHYPGDVLSGYILAFFCSAIALLLYKFLKSMADRLKSREKKGPVT